MASQKTQKGSKNDKKNLIIQQIDYHEKKVEILNKMLEKVN
jgi:hypothetical protein